MIGENEQSIRRLNDEISTHKENIRQLDTTITHELKLEGLAREIISKVQSARKDAGLQVEDRIVLSLKTESTDITDAIQAHGELIAGEVLATSLAPLEISHLATTASGNALEIGLRKA